jgi:hypothetical protein
MKAPRLNRGAFYLSLTMRFLFTILSLAFFTSCSEQNTFTKEEHQQVINEATEMLQHYCDDVKALGLTAEFKYLDSSDDFFWIPPGYSAPLSYDSIAVILKRNAPMNKEVANSYDIHLLIPLSEESAVYSAKVTSNTTDTLGNIYIYQLIESGTLIKRKDGWKLLCGQTSMIK